MGSTTPTDAAAPKPEKRLSTWAVRSTATCWRASSVRSSRCCPASVTVAAACRRRAAGALDRADRSVRSRQCEPDRHSLYPAALDQGRRSALPARHRQPGARPLFRPSSTGMRVSLSSRSAASRSRPRSASRSGLWPAMPAGPGRRAHHARGGRPAHISRHPHRAPRRRGGARAGLRRAAARTPPSAC